MSVLFWLAAIAVPFLVGKGALGLLYGKRGLREKQNGDAYITGALICMGLAEVSHLTAVFLGWSFSGCVRVFGALAAAGCLLGLLLEIAEKRRGRTDPALRRERDKALLRRSAEPMSGGQQILFIAFGVSALLQIIWITAGQQVYRAGDMTVETVNTFLASDAVYSVNPMTGLPYELGIPLRLKILSLPTYYGILSSLLGLEARTVVYHLAPAAVLFCSYVVYSRLARELFGTDAWRRGLFLLLVSLLFWTGTYHYGMDGFGALFCGYRGVSIRALVLLPCTVLACLRKDLRLAALCVLAEACIVWTFYGLGWCFLTTALMLAVSAFVRRQAGIKRTGAGRKEGSGWENS